MPLSNITEKKMLKNIMLIKKILPILLILTNLPACASVGGLNAELDKEDSNADLEEILNRAEANASASGKRVLEVSRDMITKKVIVVGGCWDYINQVHNQAGFAKNKRATIFKSKLEGPYLKEQIVEAGDWLYFVNHSYGGVEHSAIFVAWTNEDKHEAMMISYEGGNREKPAAYKKYILSNIYNVIRGRD